MLPRMRVIASSPFSAVMVWLGSSQATSYPRASRAAAAGTSMVSPRNTGTASGKTASSPLTRRGTASGSAAKDGTHIRAARAPAHTMGRSRFFIENASFHMESSRSWTCILTKTGRNCALDLVKISYPFCAPNARALPLGGDFFTENLRGIPSENKLANASK